MNERTGQRIIDAFFNALGRKEWEQCQVQLQALDKLASQEPTYRSWHTFLIAVLDSERELDWAKDERAFKALLETELEPALRGRVLMNLGITYRHQGRWPEAIKVYEECLTIFTQLDQAIDRAKVWKNMAIVLEIGFAQGGFGTDALQQAISYCQNALETLQVLDNPNEDELWLEATTWNTLGVVYFSLGDWPQATRCYERRIALGHALDDHYGIGMASNNLGEVLQRQGPEQWPEARQAYLEALGIYREFGDRYEEIDALANLGSLHDEMGQPKQALNYYDQAIAVIESLRAGVSAEQARAGFFATTADIYARAVRLSIANSQLARAFHYMERARSRAFLDLLGADSPHLERERAEDVLSLAEVQAALPPDALLLEYFTMGLTEAKDSRISSKQTPYRHRQPPAQTLLFAISHDKVEVFDLDLSPNEIFPGRLRQVVERYFLAGDRRTFLYQKLIVPVKERLAGVRRLYFVPHGPLHYIPFQALETKDGHYLFDQPELQLSYAPSATILLRHCRSAATPNLTPALTLGYNGQGQHRLQYAEEEAESIARLLNGQALTGLAPKKETLFKLGPNAASLHFSCHGQFDPQDPMASALYLGPDETLTSADILHNLRLKAHLVTLSACETGLSRVMRGDELLGLLRAFIFAGTPALVSTLWRVEEQSTRILMERFYQELNQGIGKAEALKQAQSYLRQLTRAEVEDILTKNFSRAQAHADALRQGGSISIPTTPSPIALRQKAEAYLDQLALKYSLQAPKQRSPSPVVLTGPFSRDPEAKIFDDPYFWGPFILVGDYEPAPQTRRPKATNTD